ncbi:hypothetical protein G6F68_014183 [Rhizopus microsporus]|nr:hypothetical protein G6F68_014183 [Rhizopus microsporus]
MGPGVRRAVDVLVQVVVAVLGGFIAFWSADLLLDGLDIKTAGANLPQSINYLPLAVGGALMVLFALNRARALIHGHHHPVLRICRAASAGRAGGLRAGRRGAGHPALPGHSQHRAGATDLGRHRLRLAHRHSTVHLCRRDHDARRHLRAADRAGLVTGRTPARWPGPGLDPVLAVLRWRVRLSHRRCVGGRWHDDSADGQARL